MYRVSPFVRHFALALCLGICAATLWLNLDAASYYDFIEARLADLHAPAFVLDRLPDWLTQWSVQSPTLTPASLTSHGLMALFMFFVGKELWEGLILERGALSGPHSLVPLGGVIGATLGAALVWILTGALIETAAESSLAIGWQVPLGSDVVLGYVLGRRVFGPNHPALHVLLLVTIACDFLGLLMLGLSYPSGGLFRLGWLALPVLASFGVWAFYGRRPRLNASEAARRRGLMLWPYILAGAISFIGVACAGLPPALGLLPVIPAIPHADRSFGFFAEAETFLHDPLNRLAHLLVRPFPRAVPVRPDPWRHRPCSLCPHHNHHARRVLDRQTLGLPARLLAGGKNHSPHPARRYCPARVVADCPAARPWLHRPGARPRHRSPRRWHGRSRPPRPCTVASRRSRRSAARPCYKTLKTELPPRSFLLKFI